MGGEESLLLVLSVNLERVGHGRLGRHGLETSQIKGISVEASLRQASESERGRSSLHLQFAASS